METRTIILTFLTLVLLCCWVWFIVEWIKFKKEGNQIVRHRLNGKEIGEAHKFSEWEKCEICYDCYKRGKKNGK